MPLSRRIYFATSQGLKLTELGLGIIILSLHGASYLGSNKDSVHYETAAFSITLLASAVYCIGYITNEPPKTFFQDIFYCTVGAVMYVVAGGIALGDFNRLSAGNKFVDTGLAKGSLAIFQSFFFICDGILTYFHSNLVE